MLIFLTQSAEISTRPGMAVPIFSDSPITPSSASGMPRAADHKKAWWDQVTTAAAGETIPLLVYKFDRSPVEVMFPAMLFSFQEELEQFGDYNARMLFDDFLYLFTCLLGAQNDARYV